MIQPIFITGVGTGVGKTLIAAIITEALQADYWKPVQAGYQDGTDAGWIKSVLSNSSSIVYPELYMLKMAASPHLAARNENITVDLNRIVDHYRSGIKKSAASKYLVIEGAGGLYAPLNNHEFVIDLIKKLQAKVVLVSRNYLGSINHSMLTAAACKASALDVMGWIFNDDYMGYEDEIASWSGYPVIGKIPMLSAVTKRTIHQQSVLIKERLLQFL